MNYDFSSENFKSQLKQKSNEIGERLASPVIDAPSFLLLRNLLKTASEKFALNDFRCITIRRVELDNLPDDMDEKVDALFKGSDFINHYHVDIDHNLKVLSSDDNIPAHESNDVRRHYTEISKKNIVIFLITSSHEVNYFVDGIDGGNCIFYTKEAADSFSKKKKANELESVLEDYRVHLTHRDTYEKFFITTAMLKILYENLDKKPVDEKTFRKENICLLFNKPESRFRDDLFFFLKNKMQAYVNREDFQDDENRLDISVMDNYGTYLIEIKWIGKSISANEKDFGAEYAPTPQKVKRWVNQTVGYIKQKSDEHANIKKGYLVVFDARFADINTDYASMINEDVLGSDDLKPFFFRLQKVNDFRVKNISPR